MSELKKINILQSLGKLYLSLVTLHTMNGVAAFPAESKSTNKTTSTEDKTSSTSSSSSSDNKENKTSSETTSSTNNESELGSGQVCQPNTNSCGVGENCIRFDTDKNDKYTCYKTEFAFCESNDYCKTNLGDKYKYCYLPPWASGPNQKKQCFTEHSIGFPCVNDIHCANNLSCVDNVCTSKSNSSGYDFNESTGVPKNDGNILGINKWVFISVVSFPVVVFIFCLWCWIIGRSSSKTIENKKKEKYENELKSLTIPNNQDTENKKHNSKIQNDVTPKYVDPQKEIEEEVGKRGFRSLFSKKKKNEEIENEPTTVDISSSKVGGKAPINTSATTDTQKKMKKNLTLVNLADKNANGKKVVSKKSPSTPAGSKTSSVASFRQEAGSTTSSVTNTPNKTAAKTRATKKKPGATTGAKKVKKGPSSSGNDTNTNNSTSSKQSSQRGLVNNASTMSSALSGQSSSYFSGVSSLDAQSAIYYQQMYNAAAAQAAVQNQYYASYMQNPYYAAAAQQNAAYYAAAAQDPSHSALYGNYQNSSAYH